MRTVMPRALEAARDPTWPFPSHGPYGRFVIAGPFGMPLMIVGNAAFEDEAEGWEHVSVSARNRCPNWPEMCFVKELFWEDEECVFQLHPPKSQYVNNHPFCLHLWKDIREPLRLPSAHFVGNADRGVMTDVERRAEVAKAYHEALARSSK
jgi:hypothetical protein